MDWQKRYVDKDTPWDKGAPAPELLHLLETKAHLFDKVRDALVPGCGLGHDAMILAKAKMKTVGFDISELALEKAAKLYEDENLEWQLGDLFSDLEDASFDMVWEHTCFCAIDPSMRDAYVESVANTLRPGGFVLGIFFIETGVPDGQGPPFKASPKVIKNHFYNRFSLEYQSNPAYCYEGREDGEKLMLFRRLAT